MLLHFLNAQNDRPGENNISQQGLRVVSAVRQTVAYLLLMKFRHRLPQLSLTAVCFSMIFIAHTADAAATLTQRDYAWYNDTGSTVATGTLRTSSATSTPISNVLKGERILTRIQLDNTGDATSTATYRLQWENNTDAAGTWNDLTATGTGLRYTLSPVGAMRGRSGAVPLPTRQVTSSCNASAPTYATGTFVAMSGTSTALGIPAASCTELAYVLDTTGTTLGKTYRLRVVMGSTTQTLSSYAQYPTLSITSSQNDVLRITKGGRGYSTSTEFLALEDVANNVGYGSSIAIGVDGFPVIAHQDATNGALKLYKCNNVACTAGASSTLEDNANDVGWYTSIAIGVDGFPVIAHQDATNGALKLYKCNDVACSSGASSFLEDVANDVGMDSSIAIGSDGFPVIAHQNITTGALKLYKCNDVSCTSGTSSTLEDVANIVGNYPSIAIGVDGFPVIAHQNFNTGALKLYKCNDVACTSGTSSTLEDVANSVGNWNFIAIGSDGFPVIAHNDSTARALKLYKCNDVACTSGTARTLEDNANNVGREPSIAIGVDGFPVIAHYDSTASALKLYKCNDVACTSGTSSTFGVYGSDPSIAIGVDGFPVIPHFGVGNSLRLMKCMSVGCGGPTTAIAQLPNTITDLPTLFSESEYTRVASSDNTYDLPIWGATSSRLAYQATTTHANNTDPFTVTWEGQLSVATSTYLQVWDNTLNSWVGFATNTSPTANTDFTLTTTISSNLSQYYDGGKGLGVRVVTGTTTSATSMQTDYFTMQLGATLTQRDYAWYNDTGSTVATGTLRTSSATSTPISNVLKGERILTRIQLDNTGIATSTATYRLQWENNTDAAGTWNDLTATGTGLRYTLSPVGAMRGRSGAVPLPTRQVTSSCNASAPTYATGTFVAMSGTSTALGIPAASCTELAYVLDTTGTTLGKTYRLRVVMGSTTQTLSSYAQYPTLSITSSQNDVLRITKGGRGYSTSTESITLDDPANLVANAISIAIGSDGFPVISHQDNTASALKLYKCNNVACTAGTARTLEDTANSLAWDTSIAIGSDGFPVIAYPDWTTGALKLYKCNDVACSSGTASTLESGGNSVGNYSSIAIGSDGFPVIAHQDNTAYALKLYKCNNVACTSGTARTLEDTANFLGNYSQIAIGSDGFPVIAHTDTTNFALKLYKCNDVACTSGTGSTLEDTANTVGYGTSIAIGSDGFPVISHQDNTNGALRLYKCNDVACTSGTGSNLDLSANYIDWFTSIAIGVDGYPVISYYDNTAQALKFYKCNNVACTTGVPRALDDGANDVGAYTQIAIGVDGFPVIAHQDNTAGGALRLMKCMSVECGNVASSSAQLPNTITDLPTLFSESEYTRVASSDNTYDLPIWGATSSRLAYQATTTHANNTDPFTVTWEGQLSVATSTYLQVWDNTLNSWVGFATNTSPTANTDFTLTTTISSNLSQYYDGGKGLGVRVVTGTTTSATSMQTDQYTLTFGGGSPTINLFGYRFRQDAGDEVNAPTYEAENTTLTNRVYLGDRVRLRTSLSNTGSASASNYTYRLEYASSSCTTWSSLGITSEWFSDLTQYVPNNQATTDFTGLTNPGGKTFVSGAVIAGGIGQTNAITLTSSNFTEVEYVIASTALAQRNLTYCFRVTNAGSITNFNYSTQPQIFLRSDPRPQIGGLPTEASGTGSQQQGGGQGGGGNGGGEGSGSGGQKSGGGQGGGGGDPG